MARRKQATVQQAQEVATKLAADRLTVTMDEVVYALREKGLNTTDVSKRGSSVFGQEQFQRIGRAPSFRKGARGRRIGLWTLS